MAYRQVQLSRLHVNENNDRHGEQGGEDRAIAWLMNSRAAHMRNLAKDIVEVGGLYEPPLVIPDGESYIVADGNRRLTCLKLLRDPKRAPTKELEIYFRGLASDWKGVLPSTVLCRVEIDQDTVDEILYGRHTGSQSGVGQSPWDDRAKLNFVQRTGKNTKVDSATEVIRLLYAAGHGAQAARLPRSNLNRLLSAETFRNRLGFSTKGNKFVLTHTLDSVVSASLRVANDLTNQKVVLGTLWNNEGKRDYLNSLDREGVLPTTRDIADAKSSVPERKSVRVDGIQARSPLSYNSSPCLIDNKLEYGIVWAGDTARLREIWVELSERLELSKHANAIAVLLRVLLELAVNRYAAAHGVPLAENEKLARRVEKVADQMKVDSLIDQKHLLELKKFSQSEHLLSAHTMNSYVHSSRFSPSPEHLRAVWTGLSAFIVACISV